MYLLSLIWFLWQKLEPEVISARCLIRAVFVRLALPASVGQRFVSGKPLYQALEKMMVACQA